MYYIYKVLVLLAVFFKILAFQCYKVKLTGY